MQSTAAAVTMVRDDAFFLRAWLRHYGGLLGRENCYVINHGRGQMVADLAKGCNIIGIPGDPHRNFDMKRWRLLNNVVGGLRSYYHHIIVGDVDELVVIDPAYGGTLLDFLDSQPIRRVLTPVGLEVVHRTDIESEPIFDSIIGPRRHVRLAPHYSKPCIVSLGTKLARGGHFSQCDTLHAPEPLFLFHLKFCDFGNYVSVMNHRNDIVAEVGASIKEAAIGRHWFAEARGEDRLEFERFAALPVAAGFDMTPVRAAMRASWKPRGQTGFWHFDRPDAVAQYVLPERFMGVI